MPTRTRGQELDPGSVEELCCPALTGAPMGASDAAEAARVFAALADPVRLRLLSIVASSAEVCSCELEAPLGKSQPTISHHTRVLAEVGLISGERRGRWTWWRVNSTRLAAIRKVLGD
ncbi:MAG TPA: metalloregulator ArsR/SmtB family transcription factor [Acidimicrobiales bacterium]|nr:metalloregulator ArsR/SmtB family transcription factor [Acidimicrobiales bacterium]